MTSSMTGFARREADTEHGHFAWEARSVNHRYLDLGLRLPEEFRALEPRIREVAGARIHRGKVDLALHYRRKDDGAGELALDEALLSRLVDAMQRVSKALGRTSPPDPADLLRWPGLLSETGIDREPLHAQAMALLDETLADLEAGRAREGERTAAQILDKAAQIRELAAGVRKGFPDVHAAIRDRLVQRISELEVEHDPQRLEQELVMLAQRMDVTEELERLDGHVDELESILQRDEPVGRRLDFLLQEFNREANTLASKSQDAGTTRAAVELKVLIEQVREQVQNLE